MDRRAPQPPTQRDIMFCHQCENEWYRDEHGLACPECQSEFCEVIEAHNDPRDDNVAIPADNRLPWNVPDPDEDDIDHFRWQDESAETLPNARAGDGNARAAQEQQSRQGGGFAGLIGSAIQGLFGGMLQAPDYNNTAQREGEHHGSGQDNDSTAGDVRRTTVSPSGRTITRHVHGNGYSFTMTTSSSSSLHPRNVDGPQPFQRQPETIDELMLQMLSNIGAVGPGMPQNHPFAPNFATHPLAPTGVPTGLFQLLGIPLGGAVGDAVYSQEGLDRIITQLMEQHQTGNAPGPASDAAISNLPERTITEKDFSDDGMAECSICMEAVELGSKVTVLPCQHWFHGECVGAWLSEHDTCPHCRKGIMPEANANATSPRSPLEAPLHNMHNREDAGVPGAYPLPTQSSGSRSNSTQPTLSRNNSESVGVFDRMREAFGGVGSTHAADRRGQ